MEVRMHNVRPFRPSALRRPAFAALFLVLACAAAVPATAAERIDLSPEEWREDLRALATQLPRRHAKIFHFVSRETFEREVAALDAAIPTLDDREVVARLVRLAAMIGDGHTRVGLPKASTSYPFGLRRFGDAYRVFRTTGAGDPALGMRLVAIEGTPVESVAVKLDALIAQNEPAIGRDAQVPGLMTIGGVLRGVGATADDQKTAFEFIDDAGQRHTLTLAAAPVGPETRWRLTSAELPLYRTKRAEPFLFTWLPESRTVYCNFRSYEGLARNARELFAFVDAHPTDRLVIDLRQNNGGDYKEGLKHMIEPVVARPALNQDGHLFVIIGPTTFSAAMANATHFRARTRAMLVGEPIGENPNGWSENDEFTLPNSGLQVSYSTKYYTFAPGETLIRPDREIVPTWEEFRDGRDPVLEWIVSCCRDKAANER
jgi:hypothetical protein